MAKGVRLKKKKEAAPGRVINKHKTPGGITLLTKHSYEVQPGHFSYSRVSYFRLMTVEFSQAVSQATTEPSFFSRVVKGKLLGGREKAAVWH